MGEEHEPETHLIPLILRAVKTGKPVTIFGDDYATPDGSCIRDYIHVLDLGGGAPRGARVADERRGVGSLQRGYRDRPQRVFEVVRAVEEVTGQKVPFTIGPRREGDPPALVADSGKLQRTLGWKPRYTGLREIVETAWQFEKNRTGVK